MSTEPIYLVTDTGKPVTAFTTKDETKAYLKQDAGLPNRRRRARAGRHDLGEGDEGMNHEAPSPDQAERGALRGQNRRHRGRQSCPCPEKWDNAIKISPTITRA
jgi:hypothetical protein